MTGIVMKMPDKPLISVVIPAYNYAETLPRAICSVLPQLQDAQVELIIIDDGSTDGTPEVLERMAREYPDGFRSIRKTNGGPASVRNRGILEAQGQFLVFLDADDEMAPGAIDALAAHIAGNPDSRFVIGAHWSVFADGRRSLHTPRDLPDSPLDRVRGYLLDKKIALSNGACAMHKEVFARGNYPEQFRNAEDIPVFAQVLGNYPCTVLAAPLALIHKHDDSLRHQFSYAKTGGLTLVDEVFSASRLEGALLGLKQAFYVQRCLSLFRSAYLAGDKMAAKEYFRAALRKDKRVLLKGSYARKALRLWLGK